MVDFIISSRINHHAVNPSYKCLIVDFDLMIDKHVQVVRVMPLRFNWLPRDEEVLILVRKMILISPSFLSQLRDLWNEMTIQKLHEVII